VIGGAVEMPLCSGCATVLKELTSGSAAAVVGLRAVSLMTSAAWFDVSSSNRRPLAPAQLVRLVLADTQEAVLVSAQDRPARPGNDDGGNPRDDRDERGDDGGQADILPTTYPLKDLVDVRELADAERAVARHGATPEQAEGVDDAGRARRPEHRLAAWLEHKSR
jgi:hypothetical protein